MRTSNTGINISNLPNALINQINWKGKLQYPHYFMSYAEVNYGFGTINKNYKVSVSALREDFKGFIGFENAKGQWRQLNRIWVGDWYKEKELDGVTIGDKTNSYLYHWTNNEIGHDDYIVNKFGTDDEVPDTLPTERIFIVKNAPIPCEYKFATLFTEPVIDEYGNFEKDDEGNIKFRTITYENDPHPDLMKIVDKDYIDNRFNGIRVVDVTDTVMSIQGHDITPIQPIAINEDIDTSVRDFPVIAQFKSKLQIRPYPCVYEYNFQEGAIIDDVDVIDIWDDLNCGNGKTTKELIKNNTLTFFIKLPKTKYKDGQKRGEKGIILTTNDKFTGRQFNFPQIDENGDVILDENGNKVMVNAFEHYYSPLVKWSFLGERHEIFDNAYEAQRNVLIKVQCHYEGDDLHLTCSNAFNYEPGTSNMDAITRYISNSISDNTVNKIPSSQLFFNHIFGTDLDGYVEATGKPYNESVNEIHVSKADRERWESHVEDSEKNYIWAECDNPEEERAHYHFGKHEKQTWWELLQHRVDDITVSDASHHYINLKESVDHNPENNGIDNRKFEIGLNVVGAITKEQQSPAYLVTSDALWLHAFDSDSTGVFHTNEVEKGKWNQKLDSVKGDDFITVTKDAIYNEETEKVETHLALNTVDSIETSSDEQYDVTIPTTGAVKKYVDTYGGGGIQYDEITEDGIVPKSGNFRFLGSYVHQIVETDENGQPLVKLYFGPNNNPPYATTIDGIGGSDYYLYSSSNNEYVLPNNFSFTNNNDKIYNHVYSPRPLGIKLSVNNGSLFTIPVDTSGKTMKTIGAKLYMRQYDSERGTINIVQKAHVYCSLPVKTNENGKFVFETSKIAVGNLNVFDEKTDTSTGEEITKYSVKSTIENGLQLELSEIYIHQNSDASNGLLPDNAQLKAKININTFNAASGNNTAMGETGSYFVAIVVDGKEVEMKKDFFIYGDEGTYTAPNITLSYNASGTTKWVSGIQYDTSANMGVKVTDIKNTQPQVTKTLNRLNLTYTKNDNTTSATLTPTIDKTNPNLYTSNNTNTLANDAVFEYSVSTPVTTSVDVGKFNKSVTAKLYGRDDSILTDVSASAEKIAETWLWSHSKDTESSSTITFNSDGSSNWLRNLGAWDIKNKKLFTQALNNKFSSNTKECLNDTTTSYKDELLVQGGWLKHPSKDATKIYSSLENERCFVRRIQLPNKSGQTGANQIGKIEIKIENFNQNDFNKDSAKTNVYLASTGSSRVMHLNALRNQSTTSDNVAKVADPNTYATTTSNSRSFGSWTFESTDVWSVYSVTDYYLIITMTKDSNNLGTITLTRRD